MAASEINLKDFCARQEIIAHLGRYIENVLNPRFKVDVTPGHKAGVTILVRCDVIKDADGSEKGDKLSYIRVSPTILHEALK
ncbi:hypothetical protein M407DRAFT_34414 [Tulasnella calospora MUT 4182]|uniref:Uncharacterized protein n=1 Tax=Tulasnella calospora MUT 4182 TaxID=1051891 RepID=A0A0C3L2K2_9AGAM|nr:hypothetical protein M407DRAFT_34414 [Tulasnella calospora MUT 4182]